MAKRPSAKSTGQVAVGGDNPAGALITDDGGRPVTDAGGRLVFENIKTGEEQLDSAATPPLPPVGATGTENEPQ